MGPHSVGSVSIGWFLIEGSLFQGLSSAGQVTGNTGRLILWWYKGILLLAFLEERSERRNK